MHRVGRNDHPAGGHFRANQFRLEAFALGDKFHFRRRVAGAGMFKLRDWFGHRVQASVISYNQ